ncbi:MAG: hypothetical protein M3137_12595 [Actinomycetota bacterium]|nr:hypothetical protein [Actinomycetota bacterium]
MVALLASRVISTGVLALSASYRHQSLFGGSGDLVLWDSQWYLRAASQGWAHHVDVTHFNTTGFFPGFPLAVRGVHAVTGLDLVGSGIATSIVFEVGAVVAVSALAHQILDRRSAERGVVLFALFPGAYVFTETYSEPLFVLAAALCLLALHRRWWVAAGVAAAVAGATRPTGVILGVCGALIAYREIRLRRDWSSLLAPLLSPLGLVAFLAFLWARTGSPLTYFRTQDIAWQQQPTLAAIPDQIGNALRGTPPRDVAYVVLLAAGIAGVVLLVRLRPRVPVEWIIYSVASIVVTQASPHVGLRPRFLLLTFPIIIGLGARLKGRGMATAVVASVLGLSAFAWTLPHYVP